jgi:hypothetical protein
MTEGRTRRKKAYMLPIPRQEIDGLDLQSQELPEEHSLL